jgi:hypothetical protein
MPSDLLRCLLAVDVWLSRCVHASPVVAQCSGRIGGSRSSSVPAVAAAPPGNRRRRIERRPLALPRSGLPNPSRGRVGGGGGPALAGGLAADAKAVGDLGPGLTEGGQANDGGLDRVFDVLGESDHGGQGFDVPGRHRRLYARTTRRSRGGPGTASRCCPRCTQAASTARRSWWTSASSRRCGASRTHGQAKAVRGSP